MTACEDKGRAIAVGDVVRYVGKEYQDARGQLFRAVQMSTAPDGKVQLGAMKNGMAVSDVSGAAKAWWVNKSDVEYVGTGAMAVGAFVSDGLDVTPKTGHEYEPKNARIVTRKAAHKPTGALVSSVIEQAEQLQHNETEHAAEPISASLRKGAEVWGVWIVNGDNSLMELYAGKADAEARLNDLLGVTSMLGIAVNGKCASMIVR